MDAGVRLANVESIVATIPWAGSVGEWTGEGTGAEIGATAGSEAESNGLA